MIGPSRCFSFLFLSALEEHLEHFTVKPHTLRCVSKACFESQFDRFTSVSLNGSMKVFFSPPHTHSYYSLTSKRRPWLYRSSFCFQCVRPLKPSHQSCPSERLIYARGTSRTTFDVVTRLLFFVIPSKPYLISFQVLRSASERFLTSG